MARFDGKDTADTWNGTNVADLAYGNGGNDVLNGLGGNDELYGGDGDDRLNGGDGNDILDGGNGNDTVNGGDGNDTIYISGGADTVDGGAGTDAILIRYSNATAGITIDLRDLWTGGVGLVAGGTVVNVEGLVTESQAWTTNFADTVFTGDFATSSIFFGIALGGGNDSATGGRLDDLFYGEDGDDILNGGGGDDSLIGGNGNDTVNGGDGNDVIQIENGADTVDGGAGTDAILIRYSNATAGITIDLRDLWTGGVGLVAGGTVVNVEGLVTESQAWTTNFADTVFTGDFATSSIFFGIALGGGNDSATGGRLDDLFYGEDGDDILNGGGGNDSLIGGNGNDTASYADDTAGVSVDLRITSQQNTGGSGRDTLVSIENLIGSAFADTLTGTNGANTLAGGAGADILVGLDGDDLLNGGGGADTMTGGAGNDVYVVDDAGDIVTELVGEGSDTVRTSLSVYTLAANVEALVYTGSGDFVTLGNALANSITGGDGHDWLDGAAGADILTGGKGNDIYIIDAADTIVERANEGIDEVRTALASYTLGTNLERLTFTGTGAFAGTGNGASNRIVGGNGNDSLAGGNGNDTLIGGLGDDVLDGGAGIDTADYSAAGGAIFLYLRGATPQMFGGAGADTLISIETLIGTAFSDDMVAANSGNTFYGGGGDDQLTGGRGSDRLEGGDGDDLLYCGYDIEMDEEPVPNSNMAGTEADVLLGGGGNDYVLGGANDLMDGGDGFDTFALDLRTYGSAVIGDLSGAFTAAGVTIAGATLRNFEQADEIALTDLADVVTIGGGYVDEVYGLGGDDVLTGGDGSQDLRGGDGNDTLDGGADSDRMAGGAGDDRYYVDMAWDPVDETGDLVTENADGGYDTIYTNVAALTLVANVEALVYTGSGAFRGTGNTLDNAITGGAGNDTLAGGDGDDRIDGGAGADRMIGGAGSDTYVVDSTGDRVTETTGGGYDRVEAAISHRLAANVEAVTLTGNEAINATGNALANDLVGNAAANVLNGGKGADTMAGGAGDDLYFVDDAGDVVIEAADEGIDTVRARTDFTLGDSVENLFLSAGARTGTGNALANRISGGDASETLSGLGGDDMLLGGGGTDTLTGGDGNDVLIGGIRADTLTGGAGADVFRFAAGDTGGTLTSADTITDFSRVEGDKINLAQWDGNSATAAFEPFRFIGGAAFSGSAGELRVGLNGGNTVLLGDTNGDGSADVMIRFVGQVEIGVQDLVLGRAAAQPAVEADLHALLV